MSYKSISYILGWIMKVEGVFMFLPLLVALIYREKTWVVFLGCALFCLALGFVLSHKKKREELQLLPERATFRWRLAGS